MLFLRSKIRSEQVKSELFKSILFWLWSIVNLNQPDHGIRLGFWAPSQLQLQRGSSFILKFQVSGVYVRRLKKIAAIHLQTAEHTLNTSLDLAGACPREGTCATNIIHIQRMHVTTWDVDFVTNFQMVRATMYHRRNNFCACARSYPCMCITVEC